MVSAKLFCLILALFVKIMYEIYMADFEESCAFGQNLSSHSLTRKELKLNVLLELVWSPLKVACCWMHESE